uniref:STAS domain-containing protein n=1 Tax=Paractinoplanes polyasparticus TaxID=2856853 RepID=UPI001C84B7CF|nr:STAS domain-containing protein [Actinoplanes polyasparticus]
MTVVFAVGAGVTRADIPCLCAALADLLRGRPAPGQVVCDVSEAQPDVVTIEALARLRMTAGRYGWRFNTRGATSELLMVFSLMGLGGLFFSGRYARGYPPPAPGRTGVAGGSGGEAFGQVEEREQALGVEEVVDPGDPAV